MMYCKYVRNKNFAFSVALAASHSKHLFLRLYVLALGVFDDWGHRIYIVVLRLAYIPLSFLLWCLCR